MKPSLSKLKPSSPQTKETRWEYPKWRKESFRHKLFGHIWEPVYIRKGNLYRFIACYCRECLFGKEDVVNFVMEHKPIIDSYHQEYFYQDET